MYSTAEPSIESEEMVFRQMFEAVKGAKLSELLELSRHFERPALRAHLSFGLPQALGPGFDAQLGALNHNLLQELSDLRNSFRHLPDASKLFLDSPEYLKLLADKVRTRLETILRERNFAKQPDIFMTLSKY